MDGDRAEEARAAIAAILAAVAGHAPPAAALGLPASPAPPPYAAARAAFLARAALVHPDKARGEADAGAAFAALRRAWAAVESECERGEMTRPAPRAAAAAEHQWWAEWEDGEGGPGRAPPPPPPPGDQHAAWAAGLETAALAAEVRSLQAAAVAGPPAGRAAAADQLRAARTELAERTRVDSRGGSGGGGGEGGGFLR